MKTWLDLFHSRASTLYLSIMVAVALMVGLLSTLSAPVLAQDEEERQGYTYTVQEGDSWATVASRTGVSVEALQAANPDAVRENDWLLVNEQLFVPIGESTPIRTHTVRAGESWSSIAQDYNIPVRLLQAANPQAVRPGMVLLRGERLVVPTRGSEQPAAGAPTATASIATPTVTATVTATSPETAAAVATPSPTVTAESTVAVEIPTATFMITDTDEITDEIAEEIAETEEVIATQDVTVSTGVTASVGVTESAAITETADMTATVSPTDTAALDTQASLPACPESFNEYPELMVELINASADGIEQLQTFLTGCEALVEDAFVVGDLTGDGEDDLVVVYQNPSQESSFTEGDLIIFNSADDGFELGYRARAAGEVRLLATEDINADELPDVVWVDTTCGASTCFDTLNVRSWDGSAWSDWTEGTITMAYAEITLEDVMAEESGLEIVLDGGIYGSVGAGPQRSRIEIWASMEGDPYTLVEKSYNESECLYHTVLDANRAFLDAPASGFEQAEALYTAAATDESLIKCWVRNDELEELRSFSLFRLALIAGYQGDAELAADRIAELGVTYPDTIYDQVGQVWLAEYQEGEDAAAACMAVTDFAVENPAAWEILVDYGYTNPSFEADDVCPVLELTEPDAGDGAADDPPADAAPAEGSGATAGDGATATVSLPECPADLAGYSDTLPLLLAVAGDQESLENWMRLCQVLDDNRGAVVLTDLNGDDVEDAIFFPTIITDLGFGPDGAQGAVLIYHTQEDGTYTLIANPEIYGQPDPLAIDDLNEDGRLDIAWTVVGCSTFCVLEVQMWTWDNDAYVSLIRPGATIAAGTAAFAAVPAGDPGDGQQLVLTGGVSGTPEGGLSVPHTESWQSLDGGLYQRIRWLYDRDAEGNNCLGLRLIEADVALQASPVLGFETAIELYSETLDPALQACSIFGMAADEELMLLQGLATFRLIQAHALSGDGAAAQATLAALTAGQPDSLYTEAAQKWLAELESSGDPAAACIAITAIFVENADLWQITDHFGYNHPALAAEQICYIP